MDALSSSFLSTVPVSNSKHFLNPTTTMPNSFAVTAVPSSPHHHIHLLHVSCVRIEEKPQIPTTSAPRSRTNIHKETSVLHPSKPSTPTNLSKPTVQQKSLGDTAISGVPKSQSPIVDASGQALNWMFNALGDIINNFIDPPSRASVDPRHVLSKNFAPVDELPPVECDVMEGHLLPCLDGAYIRNGPNPQFFPTGPYHLFDGDGMLHSIRISQGRATLCSRYVKTYKYTVEHDAGAPLVPSLFSGCNGLTAFASRSALYAARILTGQYNPANGVGLANTSLAYFGNHLYALGESDLPYAVRLTSNGDIETVGRHDFDGKLVMSMTAHPKIDPDTHEAFAFRYSLMSPFLTYFRFNSDGSKQPDVPICSITKPTLLHDFAVSKKYAIFPEIQLGMNPIKMFLGRSPVCVDLKRVTKIGIIPRYAKDDSEMRWCDAPGFNAMHAINAWDEEEENAIVMLASNVIRLEHVPERLDLVHVLVEKVRIDLKTEIVSRTPLSTMNLDFAVINPAYSGKKNKYVYAGIGDPLPKISGVVKVDVSKLGEGQDCTVATRMYGKECYGGEPFFVARDPENPEAEEDDGYLVSYVHDEIDGESKFMVMDAKSPCLDTVAVVRLPCRVPFGFHGLFVRECHLKKL